MERLFIQLMYKSFGLVLWSRVTYITKTKLYIILNRVAKSWKISSKFLKLSRHFWKLSGIFGSFRKCSTPLQTLIIQIHFSLIALLIKNNEWLISSLSPPAFPLRSSPAAAVTGPSSGLRYTRHTSYSQRPVVLVWPSRVPAQASHLRSQWRNLDSLQHRSDKNIMSWWL